jgi:predicted unusual protein kinase regulating ubiquinone biosynthesis (AarF/ABC1/UbiB family)
MNFESKMHRLFYNGLDNKLIKIPKIIDNNDEQIIMEYLPSRSFTKSNLSYFEAIKYSNILTIFFKHMILEHGIIHNDMHDGNWGVTDEGIVIYDFGYSTQLFDPNNIEEKELYSEIYLNSRFNEKKFFDLIGEKLTIPPIMNVDKILKNTKVDFSNEYDIFQIIKLYINTCKLNNHKIHINTYYLFSSLTITRSIYVSIFKKYNINSSEKNIRYKKLVMENAIIYTNPYYNNCKVWNKLLIDKFSNE